MIYFRILPPNRINIYMCTVIFGGSFMQIVETFNVDIQHKQIICFVLSDSNNEMTLSNKTFHT